MLFIAVLCQGATVHYPYTSVPRHAHSLVMHEMHPRPVMR